MAKESTQKKLTRVRPPRVKISYDVEVGDAIENKELPFVLGVMGDYSGKTQKPKTELKDRKFIDIDRDNFNEVLSGMAPRAEMRVDNKLDPSGESQLSVAVEFKKLDDFEPQNVVRQVEPLNKLLEIRSRLSDLRNKMTGNEKLENLLNDVVRDTEQLRQLSQERTGEGEE
jgi:type VI secretion system protein ImpB